MTADPTKTVKVFFCYAREDKALRDELEQHLSLLIRQNQITTCHLKPEQTIIEQSRGKC